MFGQLRRWDPFEELSSWHRDLDDLFSRFAGQRAVPVSNWMPPMEAYRKDDAYVVRLDLPGIDPKEVDVHAEGNLLTIKGERKSETEQKESRYRETFYGRFERSVTLPQGVDTSKIAAHYTNGVLEISVPLPKELVGRTVPIEIEGGPNRQEIESKVA